MQSSPRANTRFWLILLVCSLLVATLPHPVDAAPAKNVPAVTGATTLNENHDAVKSAVIIEMKNGKMVYKTTVKP